MTAAIRAQDVELVVRKLAVHQHGVMSGRQLLSRGVGARRLRPLLARGFLEQVSENVYRLGGSSPTDLQAVLMGVLDAPPGGVASHQTAAALWNLPGFDLRGDIHVTIPRQGTVQRRRLAIVHYHKELPLREVVLRNGIPTTTPTLSVFHLCAVLHPARVERVFDQGVVRHLTTGQRLQELLDSIGARGRNGTRLARQLVTRHAEEPPPESGLEHRVDWLGTQANVKLERQVHVGDHYLVGRADFRIKGSRGLIEAQSVLYHSSPMDAAADQQRIAAMLAAGYSVMTIWDYQAFHHPAAVISAIQSFKRDLDDGREPFHSDCPDPDPFSRG